MLKEILESQPTLVDDFSNGINPEIWKIWGEKYDDYVSYDSGVIRSENVTHDNGQMVISMTRRETPKTFKGSPDIERFWDTGWVSLQPKYGFSNGAYETEILIPAEPEVSAGVWCGIWSRPYKSSILGEIDVAESFGHGGSLAQHSRAEGFTATVHFNQTGKNHKSVLSPAVKRPISGTWFKYGLVKKPDEITIYFDRKEVLKVSRAENPEKFDKAFPPGEPYDIRFCIQAGGSWGGYPNCKTSSASHLRVRKVTIWDFEK